MMILGIGIDIQDISEFRRTLDRSGEPYMKRIYTQQEIDHCKSQVAPHESFAVRFAAKEASLKALGLAGETGVSWRDFEIISEPSGRPKMQLSGKAAERARQIGLQQLLVSLSHSGVTAAAVVIAES